MRSVQAIPAKTLGSNTARIWSLTLLLTQHIMFQGDCLTATHVHKPPMYTSHPSRIALGLLMDVAVWSRSYHPSGAFLNSSTPKSAWWLEWTAPGGWYELDQTAVN